MSLKQQAALTAAAVLVALCLAGTVSADDRDFLRERAAKPNLMFIVDSSGSMVGSPEAPGAIDSAIAPFGMVPGGGDDPYSRMGIAKRVLENFLTSVTDANYALASYAQAQPDIPDTAIPTKHWVYEALGGDRFHMIEPNFAYRFGYGETHAGILLDNPADILKKQLIGYDPYFDDALPHQTRFGPLNAFDTLAVDEDGNRLAYDLMPIYFGSCFLDDKGTPADTTDDTIMCGDRIFPFYPSGVRDGLGNMGSDQGYYGDLATNEFPDCITNRTGDADNPDDGCLVEWNEKVGVKTFQHIRRVVLEIPTDNPVDSEPNHPLGIYADGTPVGNLEITDTLGNDAYTSADDDLDGDTGSDWILYVDSVEQWKSRECEPAEEWPTWTPTPTPTNTPTATATPTPIPFDCSQVDLDGLYRTSDLSLLRAYFDNDSAWDGYITRTTFNWDETHLHDASTYVDWFQFKGNTYWGGNNSSGWVDVGNNSTTIFAGQTNQIWQVDIDSGIFFGSNEVCLYFVAPGTANGDDANACRLCDSVNLGPIPTPTNTPVNTPTATITPTPPPPTNTPTPAPPTNTPTPGPPTNTPLPPTNTPTPGPPTNTPVPPTNTPVPPTPTVTPVPPTATPLPPTPVPTNTKKPSKTPTATRTPQL